MKSNKLSEKQERRFDEKFKVKKVDNGLHMITFAKKPIYLEIDPYLVAEEIKQFLATEIATAKREERERIRKDFLNSISNHTGKFFNPWIVSFNLSHDQLTQLLSKLVEKLDNSLYPKETK